MKAIYFSGAPASGKTSALKSVKNHLVNNGYKVAIVPEIGISEKFNQLLQDRIEGKPGAAIEFQTMIMRDWFSCYEAAPVGTDIVLFDRWIEEHDMFARHALSHEEYAVYDAELTEKLGAVSLPKRQYMLFFVNPSVEELERRIRERGRPAEQDLAKYMEQYREIYDEYKYGIDYTGYRGPHNYLNQQGKEAAAELSIQLVSQVLERWKKEETGPDADFLDGITACPLSEDETCESCQ